MWLAARLFLLQSQRLIADIAPVCNLCLQGVLHCTVWEEIQASPLMLRKLLQITIPWAAATQL